MPRVDEVRAVTRRPLLRWAALCGLLALVAMFAGWQLGHASFDTLHAGDDAAGPAGSWTVLAVSASLAGLAGWILMRVERAGSQARRTGVHLRALSDLLDVWQWQTDAQHRLVQARPPAGAPTADWLAVATQPLWSQFRPADEPGLRARMAMGATLDDVEVWRRGSDGALRPGLLRGRAITDGSGAFAGYIGTLRDSSSGTLAMPSPVTASAPATADGEADHESFGYTVSHDLRAPIRVVEGFTKIVKEDYASVLDRVGHDHLDRVLGAAARMNGMIDALLALSKLSSQPLARQPVNLSQLAGFVADDLRRLFPERQVTFEVMPGMEVPGDPTLLRVVLENLLGNAWKYTGHCAHAQIRFERSAAEPPTFTIADNGAGFDMRFADRLFGVFQRLHSASEFPGTGVGLASVRRIIRRHGGEIWAEAELERGARFHFTLPFERSRL